MGFTELKQIPGIADVEETFSERNLVRTTRRYKELVEHDAYHFGDLTASFCDLSDEEHAIWHRVINEHYPFEVQRVMIRTIDAALSHKDKDGAEAPVPIEFKWDGNLSDGKTQGIRVTYASSASPSYLIEILGFPSPVREILSARRAGKAAAGKAGASKAD